MIHHSLHSLLQENISNTYEEGVDNYEEVSFLLGKSPASVY